MNLFQKLLRKAAGVVARAFSFAPTWARYAFSQFTARTLVTEGYKKNSAVSACATTLQLTFPEPPLLYGVEESGRFLADYSHPVNLLLKQPNPDMGMKEFLQFAITYAPIGGNCYVWKQRSASGKVVRLWPFSDLNIAPLAGRNMIEGFVRGYEFNSGNGEKIFLSKDDVIHWKWMIDPEYPYKGVGAIALCAKEVDRDSEATSYIFALLKNNAVPPLVVNLPPDDDSTQEEIDAMGRKWIQKHSQGQPAFIDAEMKVSQLGYDLNKLAGDSLADVPETRIAANFHVPPSVAGLNVGIKRSDYGDTAARKAFTEQTLMALWNSLASELLNGLRDDFKLPVNAAIQFDLRAVGALQELEKDKRTSINELWKGSLLTRAEAKKALGMKPSAADNVYYVSLATEFIPADGNGTTDRNAAGLKAGGGETFTKYGDVQIKAKGKPAQMLRKVRVDAARRMEKDVKKYFSALAGDVVGRLEGLKVGGLKGLEVKASVDDLLTDADNIPLEKIVRRYYAEILKLSWETFNSSLGVELAFDLIDPIVMAILNSAGWRVGDIQDETRSAIRDVLKYGSDNGWSIDQIARGDGNHPGLRDVVEETYKDRAQAIARTELGTAQNEATAARYKNAGVSLVEILDNGSDDDDLECKVANGQIWTLDYFIANSLEHPNCTRAAAPYFGDGKPDRG